MVAPQNPEELLRALRKSGIIQADIAAAIHRDRSVASKILSGKRALKAREIAPLRALLDGEKSTLQPSLRDLIRQIVREEIALAFRQA